MHTTDKRVLTRKKLRRLLRSAQAVSINGIMCWVHSKLLSSQADVNDVAIVCSQIFDGRQITIKLKDLLGRPTTDDGVMTSIGEIRFYRTQLLTIDTPDSHET